MRGEKRSLDCLCIPSAQMPISNGAGTGSFSAAGSQPIQRISAVLGQNFNDLVTTGQAIPVPDEYEYVLPYGDPIPTGYSILGQVAAQETINVMAPYFTMYQHKGPLTLNNTAAGAGQIDDGGNLIGASDATTPPTPSGQPGMLIGAKVQTPKSFYQTTFGVGNEAGEWCVVQLIDRTFILRHWPTMQTFNTGGAYWLDNFAPYDHYRANAKTPTSGDPNPLQLQDTPSIAFTEYTEYINIRDIFQDYLMYIPPGYNSQWVPLERMTWGWNVENQWDNSTRWWSPNPANQVWESQDIRWTQHPVWSNIFSNK